MTAQEDMEIRESYRGGFTYVEPEYAGVDIYGGISVDYNSMYPSMLISKYYPIGEPRMFYGAYASPGIREKAHRPEKLSEYPAWDEKTELYVQRLKCSFRIKPDGVPMIS